MDSPTSITVPIPSFLSTPAMLFNLVAGLPARAPFPGPSSSPGASHHLPNNNALSLRKTPPAPAPLTPVQSVRRVQHPHATPSPHTELKLATECAECGTRVAVEVPRWIVDAMEGQNGYTCDGRCSYGEQGDGTGDGKAAEWRESIVGGAVGVARAVRASPIPAIVFTFFKAFVAFAIYLDSRFSLHQRLAVLIAAFFEGLVEVEKELGLLKNAGEGLSIGWEALVKGVIAFGKGDGSPSQARAPHEPTPYGAGRAQSRALATQQHHLEYFNSPSAHPHSFPPSPAASRTPSSHHYPVDPSFQAPHSYEDNRMRTTTNTDSGDEDTPVERHMPRRQQSSSLLSATRSDDRDRLQSPRSLRRIPFSSPMLQASYRASALVPTGSNSSTGLLAPILTTRTDAAPSFYQDNDHRYAVEASASGYEGRRARASGQPVMTRQRSRSGPEGVQFGAEVHEDPLLHQRGWAGKTVLGWADKLMSRAGE
ncbi:hypothetical protein JCM1841_004385 [Sporobolomyces salmonicolor]